MLTSQFTFGTSVAMNIDKNTEQERCPKNVNKTIWGEKLLWSLSLWSLRWALDDQLRWLDPVFFGGVPSYFEALWYPHLYFYRKSNTQNG